MIGDRQPAITPAQVRALAALVEKAIRDEREACAAIAERFAATDAGAIGREIAGRIRARSVQEFVDDVIALAGR